MSLERRLTDAAARLHSAAGRRAGDLDPAGYRRHIVRRRLVASVAGAVVAVAVFAGVLLLAAPAGDDETADSTTTLPPETTSTTVIDSTTTTEPVTTTTGPEPVTTTTTTVPPEPQANEVVIGDDYYPPTLNPFLPGGDNTSARRIGQAIYAGLTEIDGVTLRPIPDLAVEVPSVENGGVVVADDGTTTVTFRIRQEAVWEDGTPVTGDDVVFTHQAILASTEPASVFTYDRAGYEAVASITADGKTVTLTFPQPTLAFETMYPVVLPSHQMAGTDPAGDWTDTPWMSAGPYRYESRVEFQEIVLVRNERYWKGTPAIERVVFRFIGETDRLVDAFAAGDIDVLTPPPAATTIRRLRDIDGVEVYTPPSPIWEHLTFNFGVNNRNDDTLIRDIDIRRVIAHAIDRDAIAGLGFWETPLDGILGLHGVEGSGPWAVYDHDPERARGLLAAACERARRDCAADPPLLVHVTTGNADERPAVARLLKQWLDDVGFSTRVDLEDSQLFYGPTFVTGTFEMAEWAWIASPGTSAILGTLSLFDPDDPVEGRIDQGNHTRWGTPAVSGLPVEVFEDLSESIPMDPNQAASPVQNEATERYADLLDAMSVTADRKEFLALGREAEQILADELVVIPLMTRRHAGAVWADEIAGYTGSPWIDTWNIEEWRRLDR